VTTTAGNRQGKLNAGDESGSPAPLAVDTGRPSTARVYSYAAGGKDHFGADREAAEQIMRMSPDAARVATDNRAFLARAIAYAASRGVRQYLDIGAGFPLAGGNVHDLAQAADPAARVCYVDNDPSVVLHLHGRVESAQVVPVFGDLREPWGFLGGAELNGCVDLGEPVAVILGAVLHFLGDGEASAAVEYVKNEVAPGSFLVVSHATGDGSAPGDAEKVRAKRAAMGSPVILREGRQIGQFFDGWQWVAPGLVNINDWQNPVPMQSQLILYGGAARKPRRAS
jgi:hypothetical protein